MITINFFIFVLVFLLISLSLIGYGRIINYRYHEEKYLENIFFGFVFLTFINTFFHFFIKLSLIYNFLIFIIGIIIFFKKSFNYKKIKIKKIGIFLFILLLLIPIFISQKYHEDFGYYHLPYALLLFEEKIIFGIANTNIAYVYNSIWLNIYPSFFLFDKNFNFLTFPTFILYVFFISFLINDFYKNHEWNLSKLYVCVLVFYYLIKFTRISEYGVDLPASIFANISIIYFIKFFETEEISDRKKFF